MSGDRFLTYNDSQTKTICSSNTDDTNQTDILCPLAVLLIPLCAAEKTVGRFRVKGLSLKENENRADFRFEVSPAS